MGLSPTSLLVFKHIYIRSFACFLNKTVEATSPAKTGTLLQEFGDVTQKLSRPNSIFILDTFIVKLSFLHFDPFPFFDSKI